MAQATGIQALGRAAQLLDEPKYAAHRPRARSARSRPPPPTGVRTTGPRGGVALPPVLVRPAPVHLQRLPPVADRAVRLLEPDRRRRARPQLYDEAESTRRAPRSRYSDVGDWSLYNYAGHESSRDYHELLREFLESLCTRRQGAGLLRVRRRSTAATRSTRPTLTYERPGDRDRGPAGRAALQRVEAVGRRGEGHAARRALVFDRIATFRRGTGAFTWTPQRAGHVHRAGAAKELRTGLGKRDRRHRATIEVENRPG